jgi:predicted flap endonuclease-1-like 5' DNA nuclease
MQQKLDAVLTVGSNLLFRGAEPDMAFFLSKTWPWFLLAAVLAAVLAWIYHGWKRGPKDNLDAKVAVGATAGAAALVGAKVGAKGSDKDGKAIKVDCGHDAKLAAQAEELLSLRGRLADIEGDKGELVTLRGKVSTLQGELDKSKTAAKATAAEPTKLVAAAPAEIVPNVAEGARVLGFAVKPDDLKVVEGIGPKIEGLLRDGGIRTWRQLAEAPVTRLKEILDAAGPRYQIHNPATWPRQAEMLSTNKWAEFKKWTEELTAGRE